MLKFQLVICRLMFIMVDLNPAALLFCQLFQVWLVFAGALTEDRTALVSRGDSHTFTCNISYENAVQVIWTRDRFRFIYSLRQNQTFSNFSSLSLRINPNIPSNLRISNIQHEDAGLYSCQVSGRNGFRYIRWNLTVFEVNKVAPKGLLDHINIIIPSALGLLLGCIMSAFCLCRKHRTAAETQEPVQNQFQSQSEGQTGTDRRANNKQSRAYMERLNICGPSELRHSSQTLGEDDIYTNVLYQNQNQNQKSFIARSDINQTRQLDSGLHRWHH
ncbi:uncharacterized protein LOC133446412 [Cololabis saira]|uniref:uncharacterized protein LOC133446412 n=1 Tax=Cololabis saira TaxID=129043 RepID=UPI002AD1D794|nr:uncharacterized protein LOC133446412 [Cololabis saira]